MDSVSMKKESGINDIGISSRMRISVLCRSSVNNYFSNVYVMCHSS